MSVSSILGVGGLLSNVYSNIANEDRNQQNLDWQKYQYEDSKIYNSPVNQVRRLRQAGLNPALMYGNINPGQVTPTSPPSQLPAESLNLSGLASLSSGIDLNDSQLLVNQSLSEKYGNEAAGYALDNAWKNADWLSKIQERGIRTNYTEKLKDLAAKEFEFADKTLDFRIQQQDYALRIKKEEWAASIITASYLPTQITSQVNELMARCKYLVDTGQASLKQAHAAIMHAVNESDAFSAQYGSDPNARQDFFKASMDYLMARTDTEYSKQYHNIVGLPNNSYGFKITPFFQFHTSQSKDRLQGRYDDYWNSHVKPKYGEDKKSK